MKETQLNLCHQPLEQVKNPLNERREHIKEQVDNDNNPNLKMPVCRYIIV